jgi:hypothetical protein
MPEMKLAGGSKKSFPAMPNDKLVVELQGKAKPPVPVSRASGIPEIRTFMSEAGSPMTFLLVLIRAMRVVLRNSGFPATLGITCSCQNPVAVAFFCVTKVACPRNGLGSPKKTDPDNVSEIDGSLRVTIGAEIFP